MTMRHLGVSLLIAITLLAACQAPASDTANAVKFKMSSPAFQDSGLIPKIHTCQGENKSPELNWSQVPVNTHSFALIVDDPDAPGGTFTHWVLYDMPARSEKLAAGASNSGVSGLNSTNQPGYMGPCPPSGIHRYYFKLYALDVPTLGLPAGATRQQLEAAMQNHILGTAETMGKYEQQ